MARTAQDLAIFLKSSVSHTVATHSRTRQVQSIGEQQAGHLRIAFVQDVCGIDVEEGIAKVCRDAAQTLQNGGHTVEDVALDFRDGRSSFLTLRAQWMRLDLDLLDRIDELGENLQVIFEQGLIRSRSISLTQKPFATGFGNN